MIWAYCLLVANAAGFLLCAVDKRRAKRRAWRIPERTLFLAALLGGAPGVLAGMHLLRHKTRHWYFVWGVPIIALAEYGAFLYWIFAQRDMLAGVMACILNGG